MKLIRFFNLKKKKKNRETFYKYVLVGHFVSLLLYSLEIIAEKYSSFKIYCAGSNY